MENAVFAPRTGVEAIRARKHASRCRGPGAAADGKAVGPYELLWLLVAYFAHGVRRC